MKSQEKYQYYPIIKNKLIYHEKIISVIFMLYGEKLKYLREEKELHQKDLAELINVHPATYSQFEREDVIMPIKRLNTYSNFFNVSLDYLFNFTNIKQYKNIRKEINPILSSTRLKEFRKEHKITQVNLAKFLRVPTLVIGLTVVAIATGVPEIAISITSSIKGSNGLLLGNLLGSNMFNILFILGLIALIKPLLVKR